MLEKHLLESLHAVGFVLRFSAIVWDRTALEFV